MLHGRARGTCSNPIGFSRHQRAAEEMWKQIQCGSAKAQHCSSMGWWTLVWRAALRAWAPFVVDVVKATHCAAFMQRAPTAAPLADHSLWVRRVWSEAAAAAAMEPGSTSGNGQTLRLAALYRPASRRALGIIGRFGRSTRCFDSVGLLWHRGGYGGYLVLFWPPQARGARVFCVWRGLGARYR